jgi:hypothetical protein
MSTTNKLKVPPILYLIGLAVVGIGIWSELQDSGFISHDYVVTVYSPEWRTGEYKSCTTINGNGDGAPEQPRGQQNILCDGGVPSGNLEDGKQFNIKFWGKTYDDTKKHDDLLLWKCKKNPPDADAAFDCRKDSQ